MRSDVGFETYHTSTKTNFLQPTRLKPMPL